MGTPNVPAPFYRYDSTHDNQQHDTSTMRHQYHGVSLGWPRLFTAGSQPDHSGHGAAARYAPEAPTKNRLRRLVRAKQHCQRMQEWVTGLLELVLR